MSEKKNLIDQDSLAAKAASALVYVMEDRYTRAKAEISCLSEDDLDKIIKSAEWLMIIASEIRRA